MIDFKSVSKRFGAQEVLRDASFRINTAEHAGIVGPNGTGKSTLFELIVGATLPDSGTIETPTEGSLGYVRQEIEPDDASVSLRAYVEAGSAELHEQHERIVQLEAGLAELESGERERRLRQIGELQTRFEAMGGYDLRTRVEAALGGLGFTDAGMAQPLGSFSGGWQMRAELARVLVLQPDVLLLDEPSNYLDVPAVEWLQRYLREFQGTLALISHDRYLLNSLTTVTIELVQGRTTRYPGNYDAYADAREMRYRQAVAAKKNQDRKREQMQRFVDRFRAKNTKASQVQSMIRKIDRLEEVETPDAIVSPGTIRLRPPPRSGEEVMRLDDAGMTYDGRRWILRHVNLRVMRGDKTAVVGLNGMGKTTLLRVLADRLELGEGRRVCGHKVNIGYQSQDFVETIDPRRTVFETVKSVSREASESEVRGLLGGFGFSGDAVEKTVAVLSGGEKIRLAFARLLVDPPNFLLLDEPTTHLDVQARVALENALREYEGTIYMVSHDIEFIRRVATTILEMRPPGVRLFAGGYDYYAEKKAAEAKQASGAGASPPARPASEPAKRPRNSDGLSRHDRARRVQAFARAKRPLERRLAKAEQRVEEIEAERRPLLEELSESRPGTDYAAVNRTLAALQAETDQLTREWEHAAAQLEELQQQFDDGFDRPQMP